MSWFKNLFGGRQRAKQPKIPRGDPDIAYDMQLLGTAVLPTAGLVRDFPPIVSHPNKQLLFDVAKDGPPPSGEIVVSRFSQMPLPDPDLHRATLTTQTGEALLLHEDAVLPTTRDHTGATPVLIQGVERRLQINTVVEGHGSIYGARFGQAPASIVRAAANVLERPTISSILAIEAPIANGQGGRYDSMHIEDALTTAYSGFRAAVLLDHRQGRSTTVHTGFWGCGAYGGDPVLMTMIQLFAAHLAGVSEVVFHTVDRDPAKIERAHHLLKTEFSAETTRAVVGKLARAGFTWGTPDGN